MRGPRTLELNEVSLNGDGSVKETPPGSGNFVRQGGYFRKKIFIGKPKDQKPEEIDLGKAITVLFLKIRRKLVERAKGGEIVRSTNEHNSTNESVMLYETGNKDGTRRGVASDLRKQFPNLRTVQIVYALLVQSSGVELVRLVVKGASLGSETKDKNVPDFYEYISSFKGDDHFYQFKTELSPVIEEGKQTYYAINFQRGEKLSEKSYELAMEHMKAVHTNCTEVDTQRAQRIVKETTASDDIVSEDRVNDEVTAPDYPADDINPEDIPF